MLKKSSKSHSRQVELLGSDPWCPAIPGWHSGHRHYMTTCASWYGKEKAGEQGDLKTKDPREPRTGLGRARPVLQAAVFMGSSYLGQRGSHKASRACALQWMACVCWSERTSMGLNNQGCFSHSPHWESSELHAPSSPLMSSEDSHFHVIAVLMHYYLNKWNQSIYIYIYMYVYIYWIQLTQCGDGLQKQS